jgi:type IV pilus assembly protein PilM
MPSLFGSLTRLLQDPPPELVFEIAPDAVRMARVAQPLAIMEEVLPHGVISPSPLHDNIALPEPLNQAVARLHPNGNRGKRRTAALLLPDHCAHVSVLDFDNLPDKPEEQVALIRFRLKRSVPFDVETAALSCWVQDAAILKGRREIVVAVTALEIISRYEAPFRAAGIHPGLVTLAPLACLDLVAPKGIVAIARLSGSVITILVKQENTLRVIRSIQLDQISLPELGGHLHQTFVYIEDNLGAPAQELLLCGFGDLELEALQDFPAEFQVPVRVLGGADTGIRGYLKGVAA